MKPFSIIRADLEDAEAILRLQREAYQSEAVLYNDWNIPPLTQTLEELRREFQSSVVLKAVSDGCMVGSVRGRIENGIVHIGRLIVDPAHQRRGIGGDLLAAMESVFPDAQGFELFTGDKSEHNIRLYHKHGYKITHEKALSSKVTLVFMRKM